MRARCVDLSRAEIVRRSIRCNLEFAAYSLIRDVRDRARMPCGSSLIATRRVRSGNQQHEQRLLWSTSRLPRLPAKRNEAGCTTRLRRYRAKRAYFQSSRLKNRIASRQAELNIAGERPTSRLRNFIKGSVDALRIVYQDVFQKYRANSPLFPPPLMESIRSRLSSLILDGIIIDAERL